jgi:hypothetical protein
VPARLVQAAGHHIPDDEEEANGEAPLTAAASGLPTPAARRPAIGRP